MILVLPCDKRYSNLSFCYVNDLHAEITWFSASLSEKNNVGKGWI